MQEYFSTLLGGGMTPNLQTFLTNFLLYLHLKPQEHFVEKNIPLKMFVFFTHCYFLSFWFLDDNCRMNE